MLSGEDLVGDLAEVGADNVGLRVDGIARHAGPRDERCAASSRKRAGNVPGMRGDQRHFADRDGERARGQLVGLERQGLPLAHKCAAAEADPLQAWLR